MTKACDYLAMTLPTPPSLLDKKVMSDQIPDWERTGGSGEKPLMIFASLLAGSRGSSNLLARKGHGSTWSTL